MEPSAEFLRQDLQNYQKDQAKAQSFSSVLKYVFLVIDLFNFRTVDISISFMWVIIGYVVLGIYIYKNKREFNILDF